MSVNDLINTCPNVLPGHGPEIPIADLLREIADSLDGSELQDSYGSGKYIQSFESEVAELFGTEAAVFMPSGILAQQIALRIWCQRSNNYTVAMHPTSHLEFAEQLGYQYLHGIHRLQFGVPEFLRDRLLVPKDLEELGVSPGVVLLELPCRPLGGQLHPWDDLTAIHDWTRQKGVSLHLDGARIWSCRSYYQKNFAEIGNLFDSIYVSFYKDLGGLCGSMLMGSEDFIKESRVWQRRMGGNLVTQAPFVASAQLGMKLRLPQIASWVERARQIAGILSGFEDVLVHPREPDVNMFQLFIKGDPDILTQRHHALAEETGTFLFYGLDPAAVPGYSTTELHIWENAMAFDIEQLAPFIEQLLE